MQAAKRVLAAAVVAALVVGCGDGEAGSSGGASAGPTEAQSGFITGKVTMPDGKTPPTGDIKDIAISIYGVSEAAEKVHYSPAVKPDGSYRQKVSGGQYGFNPARITLLYNNAEFPFTLEPVGNLWNKNRDAAEGIAQDFIFHPKGPTPYGKSNGLDIGNATHWYGMSIGMRAEGYRNDIGKVPTKIPDNAKLIFTLKPTGQAIDGSEPKEPVVFERVHNLSSYASIDLNDILPAPYELTGTVTFPDGTTKPLLIYTYKEKTYKPMVPITVERDNISGGMFKHLLTYVID